MAESTKPGKALTPKETKADQDKVEKQVGQQTGGDGGRQRDQESPEQQVGQRLVVLVSELVRAVDLSYPAHVGRVGAGLLARLLGLFRRPDCGLGLAVLLPMIVLVRRAKKATYRRYAGQAGSAEVAMQMLPKKWVSTPAIAANRNRDVIHRTLGPGGLVLIGEGEPGRVRQLLASEVKKHERVAYGVTVTTVIMGNKDGQVPLDKLADHIRKLPKALQPNQITDIRQRLRALDALRPPVPVPKGPMPTNPRQVKGARQAMRGR